MECSCEEVREIIREELTKIGKLGPRGRVKRRPSSYNLFMGSCMKTGTDMKGCAVQYKGLSEREKDALKVQAESEASRDEAEF